MKLKRKRERIMSICLTRFPNKWVRITQYIPQFGDVLQELWVLSGGSYTALDDLLTCAVRKD